MEATSSQLRRSKKKAIGTLVKQSMVPLLRCLGCYESCGIQATSPPEDDFVLPILQKYTEALTLCPDWSGNSCCYASCIAIRLVATYLLCPVLLVNRALCQKKRTAWSLVQQDAEAALAIDSHLLKVDHQPGCQIPNKHSGSVSADSSVCYQLCPPELGPEGPVSAWASDHAPCLPPTPLLRTRAPRLLWAPPTPPLLLLCTPPPPPPPPSLYTSPPFCTCPSTPSRSLWPTLVEAYHYPKTMQILMATPAHLKTTSLNSQRCGCS